VAFVGGATEISRRTDYAVRMLVELARLPRGSRIPAHRLGESLGIPQAFARRIVSELAASGLVDTQRGAGGGVGLSRDASQISLGDVVAAVEGGIFLNACTRDPRLCGNVTRCPAHVVWQRADVLLSSYLAACDLATLAAGLDPAEDVTPGRADTGDATSAPACHGTEAKTPPRGE
jgi:Rrf2 family nitric oxide-sensitive transcriptional repressor